MLALGYKASAEQFGPVELLGYALEAERRGFDTVAVSDHYQPFRHTEGHAPAAFPWLGALAARSQRIRIGTSVSTPTLRYHPAMVAQAFATIACLAPGRVFLGVGTGESVNEVPPLGIDWPRFGERLGRLEEAVALIRRLWSGERVSHDGRYYRTVRATIYDRPPEPVPILIAAAGPRAARFAGAAGDDVDAESRFIVSDDPEEQVERIGEYVELGFRHLVFHSPAPDQARFLELFGADVVPRLRDRYG